MQKTDIQQWIKIIDLLKITDRTLDVVFCLRVIVNEKPHNLEKTTSSVLSVNVNYSMIEIVFRRLFGQCSEYTSMQI